MSVTQKKKKKMIIIIKNICLNPVILIRVHGLLGFSV